MTVISFGIDDDYINKKAQTWQEKQSKFWHTLGISRLDVWLGDWWHWLCVMIDECDDDV